MAENTRDLTKGPVWQALALMSAPMVIGILAVLSVGLADAYFLGQLGGAPLAAVGFIYPVTAAVTSLSIGLSAGANALVSQAIGAGDDDAKAARLAFHAVSIAVVLSLIGAAAFFFTFPPLFKLLGANEAVMAEIALFMPWWCASFPFLVLMMLVNAIFRSHGDSNVSATLMVISAVINVGLDPILIFGFGPIPQMGTEGAALATFIARASIAGVALAYALHQSMLYLCANPLKGLGQSAWRLAKIGGPAAFSNAINPAGMAAVTAAVATVGEAAVGGFGAATRVQQIALVPMLALSSGIGPVIGQNWGAEQKDRAARALQAAFAFCLGYGVVVGLLLAIFAQQIASLLASDPDAAGYAATYMRIVGWSLFGYGFVVVANAAMNARDKAVWSMSLSLGRIFLIYLPGAWLGVTLLSFTGITFAAFAANVVAAVAAVGAAYYTGLLRPNALRQTFS